MTTTTDTMSDYKKEIMDSFREKFFMSKEEINNLPKQIPMSEEYKKMVTDVLDFLSQALDRVAKEAREEEGKRICGVIIEMKKNHTYNSGAGRVLKDLVVLLSPSSEKLPKEEHE